MSLSPSLSAPTQDSPAYQDATPPLNRYYALDKANPIVVSEIDLLKFLSPPLPPKEKRKQKQSIYWKLDIDTSWNQMNLTKLEALHPRKMQVAASSRLECRWTMLLWNSTVCCPIPTGMDCSFLY